MNFRKDINGLRAYAVLAVMLFHFNKEWLPGGFIGVDVFFVISGYLMTGVIFRGLTSQSFSLLKFYAARIRRIIPALLVLVIILIILGYLFLGPASYRNLSKESIRSLLFISNFLYWRDTGYFDLGAMSKPLLHTWSLSVEWQFYIIYPIILAILAKFLSIMTLKRILIVITLISLGLTIYFSYQSPTAAYFLLPTRIWEMLLGGLAFLYPFNLSKNKPRYILEILGIALIVLSAFIISERMPWPGYMALLPTIGAFIIIQANGQSLLTTNIAFQKIGLWSYSLYLYHWPLIFINHRYNLHMNVWTFLTLSFLLATASYYLIELRKWQAKFILIAVIITLIPIYGIYKTKGAEFRVSGKHGLTAAQMYGGGLFPQYQEAYTLINSEYPAKYLMIGDSVSRQYASFLMNQPYNIRTLYADACMFTPNYSVYIKTQMSETCSNFVDEFYDRFIKENPKMPIIWAQNWNGYTLSQKEAKYKPYSTSIDQREYSQVIYNEIKNMITQSSDRNIYLIGAYVVPTYNIYECLSAQELSKFAEVCPEFIPRTNIEINEILKTISNQYPNVYFIDPSNGYCNEKQCRMITNNEPMFTDLIHLTTYGADIIGSYIFDEIKKIESKEQ